MGKSQKIHIYQKNNCTCKYYELNLNKGFGAFDIGETTDLKEINMDELLFNAYKTGEKIFNNIKDLITETDVNGNIIEQIEKLDLDTSVTKNIEHLEKWCGKYGFPTSPPLHSDNKAILPYTGVTLNDISTFSKHLMIFYLIYSFHLNLVFLYNDKIDYYIKKEDTVDLEDYINKFETKIDNINILGSLFIQHFEKLDLDTFIEKGEEQITIKKYKKERQEFIENLKIPYLKAVNNFSYNLKNSIISIVDIENNCIDISSENTFHLIWHIFMNYIVLDTKPSKICECKICHIELIQTGTKKPTRCEKHKNTGKQEEKDLKKEKLIHLLLNACIQYKINDKEINIIQQELKNVLKKGNSERFRKLKLATLKDYKKKIGKYIKINNLHKK